MDKASGLSRKSGSNPDENFPLICPLVDIGRKKSTVAYLGVNVQKNWPVKIIIKKLGLGLGLGTPYNTKLRHRTHMIWKLTYGPRR